MSSLYGIDVIETGLLPTAKPPRGMLNHRRQRQLQRVLGYKIRAIGQLNGKWYVAKKEAPND